MQIEKLVGIVLAFLALGGVVGAGIGTGLGLIAPDFYASAFGAKEPVQFGLGIGIANGLMIGFLLGVLVVICLHFGRKR